MPAMERTREAFHFLTCTNKKVPKVRSKLRKPVSRQKRKDDSRRVVSDTHGKSKSSKHRNTTADISITITAAPPHLPPVTVSPEFKGREWLEYPWSSFPRVQPGPEDLPGPLPPAGIIPEFSHLAVSDADRSGFLSPASQVSPKRRAKTPILFIGQLESANIPRPRNALANEGRFSASLLAEEYRALLDSPSSSLLAPTWSDPTLIARERLRRKKASSSLREEQSQPAIPRRGSIAPLNYHTGNVNSQNVPPQVSLFAHVHPPPTAPNSQSLQPEPSLRSDADTLVAIDEEGIDFKPEFAPPPPPRPPSFSHSISDYSLPPSTSSSSTSSSTPTSASTPTFTFTSPSTTSTPTPMSTSACTSRSTSRSTPASRSTSTSTSTPTFPATSTSTTTSRTSPTPPPIVQKDLSLQICLDLLTRDLSSHLMPGLRRRQNRHATKGTENKLSTETAALQVWVMIEGYEKLKEELLMRERQRQQQLEQEGEEKDGEDSKKDRKTVKTMLETWLSALYRIYDELSVEAFEGRGENGEENGEGSDEGSESSFSGDYGDRGYGSE
ncbi:hypothetical protein NEUTE1DRAFT_124356 [Neurospora tetrasperma FGSC 2508]|uniref:Uncharacterized protein n=1 Tax=Neurospora tetrasperma (strain FGSC 2508 / ATCC MYA-4615 / P0657) TaxID=510951 RepID=F8MVS5_NEUT8|nr:uncharacterized protein NEUTE1DRAFT_124356 [Neurospora tetrasperma FGSC 2508]EGO53973.1 hypothetical protein NEUTE1DRAFT_124356 [Neurospora tetrasperma FGSC 2508]EGZ68606.1 hypothetical protein NEUTE2DRAFT_118599 [Neurospora tetrasperma FGSC 2509]